MNQDEIIEMARQAGLDIGVWEKLYDDDLFGYSVQGIHENLESFAKLVAAKAEARYMQLFLDPENQPTQFGTATQEYREKEVKEVQDLLTDLAHHVRTKHLYGMEVQKMLEKEAAIRARGEA